MENQTPPPAPEAGGSPPPPPPSDKQPVVLQPRNDDGSNPKPDDKKPIRLARRTFRPSHKATFIALGITAVLIIANALVVGYFVLRKNKSPQTPSLASIDVSQSLLSKLGVNSNPVGTSGETLIVSPNAEFNGTLSVEKDVKLGNKLTAGDASLVQIEAGNTALTQLNVSGSSTLSDTAIRTNFTVAGTSHLQGDVSVDKLLTAGTLNVSGNLTVGGSFTTNNFSARSLTSTSTLTIAGHVITGGLVPTFTTGPAPGPAGTVSISGNDSSGTVVMNTGQSPVAGIIINITFRTAYSVTPHVVISPVGPGSGGLGYYVNRSSTGFSIGITNTPPQNSAQSFAYDYIVEQ